MTFKNLTGDVVLSGVLPSGATNSPGTQLPGGGPQSVLFAVHSTAVSGTSPTLDVKLQESDLPGSGFADVTGAALTQVTAAGQQRLGYAQTTKAYVRLVGTVGGSATPTVTATASIFG